MKIVVISDTHDKVFNELPEGDVLIHCGDYSNYGCYDGTKKFFEWFVKHPHKYKIVIPGNHEKIICPFKNHTTKKWVAELIYSYRDRVKFLVDEELVIEGVKFYGTPWCNGDSDIMAWWGFYIEDDEERTKMFAKIPSDTDILISHVPPYGIQDEYMKRLLGCTSLIKRVFEIKPLVHVFGHIHSANGHVEHNGINFYNCAVHDRGTPCHIIEISGGKVISSTTEVIDDEESLQREIQDALKDIDTSRKTGERCYYCRKDITEKTRGFISNAGVICKNCFWTKFD